LLSTRLLRKRREGGAKANGISKAVDGEEVIRLILGSIQSRIFKETPFLTIFLAP
jgi:hypothetical protein